MSLAVFSEETRKIRKELKQMLLNEIGASICSCCGDEEFGRLWFHHDIPELREFNIANGTNMFCCGCITFEMLAEEARKCTVLCPTCHNGFHHGKRPFVRRFNRPVGIIVQLSTDLGLIGRNKDGTVSFFTDRYRLSEMSLSDILER